MDVLELIDELRDLVDGAKQVPLRDQVRMDKEKLYDLLDQMRSTIPEEIKQARGIVTEREEMLAEAKREAERIVEEARGRQSQLVAVRICVRPRRPRRRRAVSTALGRALRAQIVRTLAAFGPLGPCSSSYSTFAPSASDLKPLPAIAVWWTKRSLPPSSGLMKP
jgi:hypothetical protein